MLRGRILQSRFDRVALGWALPLIFAAACSASSLTPDAVPTSADAASNQRIGARGGTLTESGATLEIPPGALTSDTTFTIRVELTPALDGIISKGFVFGPDVTFAKPVTITIPTLVLAGDAHLFWIPPTNGLDDLAGVASGSSIAGQVSRLGGLAFACIPNDGSAPRCDVPSNGAAGTGGTN